MTILEHASLKMICATLQNSNFNNQPCIKDVEAHCIHRAEVFCHQMDKLNKTGQ